LQSKKQKVEAALTALSALALILNCRWQYR